MKPSARLRTAPRSASLRLAIGAPWMSTSPADGASSPPSRCSSVLLPEPDAPTIATRSPVRTAEIDAKQHRHVERAAAVGLGQTAALEHRHAVTHSAAPLPG